MLDYTLIENLLTAAPDDYMAHTVNVRSYTDDEIAERMLRSGAGLTKSDILSVLEAYKQEICNIIAEGDAVNTPVFNAQPSVAGVFTGASDTFDPRRHHVKINLSQGTALRDALTKVKTQKVQVPETLPLILEVKDTVSGSVNDTLTAGTVIQLTGSRLKLITGNDTNGIFLINAQGAETRFITIIENKPARLIALLPNNLQAGQYTLEVRTTYSKGAKESSQLKKGHFHKEINIVEQP